MEKDYRLFVKNLPLNIDDNGLRKIFHKFVTIKKVDLKEKKDLNNKVNTFAFVNVTTTDKGLHECFGKLNGERFNGFEISVELAKESFLDRLKREREESNQKKEPPKDYTKPFVLVNLTSTKSKHKKFDDVDFSSKEFEVEKVKKKRKSSVDDTNDFEDGPVQSFEDVEYKIKVLEETSDSFKVEKKKYVNKLDTASTEINNVHRNKKAKRANEDGPVQSFEDVECKIKVLEETSDLFKVEKKKYVNKWDATSTEINNVHRNNKVKRANEFNNNKPMKYPVHEAPVNKSEQKRLMSLKEKKKVFKAQEKVIRNALKSVDEARLNKKIVFGDDIDIESTNGNTQSQKKKTALFESDSEEEEAEEFGWNEQEVEAKANTKKKLLKMQTSIGNDRRFVLDERFVDDDDDDDGGNVKETTNSGQNDDVTLDEKKWTLGILEQVLGKPIAPPSATSGDTLQPKKKMIRYDPTADGHEKYEVAVEKSKEEKRKKKKKKVAMEQVEEEKKEEAPIPTSKEIFYDVSDKLADSFKPTEGFSLLKTLGRDAETDKPKTEPVKRIENNESGFQFSFTKNKNPFNYDSSDNEDGKGKSKNDYNFKLNSNEQFEDDEGLFAPLRDSQVEELNKFFNTPSTVDDEAFKRRRRELKKIVRTKIRNNVKKATPWNKKKVWKQKKKQR